MNKSAEGISQKATSAPHTDDESITTSTESDSLETWTLVNDKNKNRANTSQVEDNHSATNNRVEILTDLNDILTNDNKEKHESADSRTDDDSIVDDGSEGISIISESESAGRASPLAMAENFNSVDFNICSNPEEVYPASMLRLPIHIPQPQYALPSTIHHSDENAVRQRRIRRSSSSATSERKVVKSVNGATVEAKRVYPLVRRGLKGFFYICITLAILAFIGKLRNPDWQSFFDKKNLSVLEQKLTGLELQNNLMRAEIDILSKQVNYLSSLNQNGGRMNRENVERGPKSQQRFFKQTGEWIMKQKGIDLVDKPEDDLKKSFKCPDGKYVEIASMCEENEKQNIKNMDDILKVVDEIMEEQIVDDLSSSKEEIGAEPKEHGGDYKNKRKYVNIGSKNSKESGHHSSENKYETQKHWKRHNHLHRDSDDDFSEEDEDFDDSLEDFGKKKFTSKESYNKHEHIRSNGDKYKGRHPNDNFKDRHSNDRSKERRFNGNSKENLYVASDEQSRKSGEWHGKLMQQRENARRQNEYQQRNKNWFIERGDNREKMRHRR
ncbi:uncharacterized protein LOC129236942 [Anastrepha obliqua]|uniref:uncharacterized protein LOC129236942 n=1 Tax=Anastrepha obliqua TaxID=95512 RepID=UPI00240A79DC|nr:uncharacterized protein LOC129236942 [Anastrepha obliqua]